MYLVSSGRGLLRNPFRYGISYLKAPTASSWGLGEGGDNMGKKEEYIVGLDIGTTKICAIVGVPTANGLDISGIGTHPSHGLRKGVVVNIESTVQSIKRAVEEAG